MNRESVEFGEALLKVTQEFQALTGGARKDMTVEETGELMKYILARCDFSKPEEQLTNEEGAWKVIYDATAAQMSKALGAQQWKDLEKSLVEFVKLSKCSEATDRLVDVVPRIETLFVQQQDRLGFHTNEKENDYKIQENQLSTRMLDKALSDQAHRESAEAILRLADQYKERYLKPFAGLNETLGRELTRFEVLFNSLPVKTDEEFARLIKSESIIFRNLARWLTLSKELYSARLVATDVIGRQIECDLVIPRMVVEKGGNLAFGLTQQEGAKFKHELEECASLMKQSFEANQRIQAEREPLTRAIFPTDNQQEVAQAPPSSNTTQSAPIRYVHPLEGKAWFRFVKMLYIGAWLVGVGLSLLLGYSADDLNVFIGGAIFTAVVLIPVRKMFYYVTLGRTTVFERPGGGFIDVEELKADLANARVEAPEMYKEIIEPFLDSAQKQYGRRIPQHVMDSLRLKIDEEVQRTKKKRDDVVKEATAKGASISIAHLRQTLEAQKGEYTGEDSENYFRQMDEFILSLEVKYGTSIPLDESQKILDRIEDDIRKSEKARGQSSH